MKKCIKCNIQKPLTDFPKRSLCKDGTRNTCKVCWNAYCKEHRSKPIKPGGFDRIAWGSERREALKQFVYDYLKSHPCVDCGESNPIVLEFDHIRDKVADICVMIRYKVGINKLSDEISKCEVRCANCHRIVTAKRGDWWIFNQISSENVNERLERH